MKNTIGLDVGRSSVKIVATTPGGDRHQVDFPSAFCRAIRISDVSAAARAAAETVSVEGVEYFVGNTAIIQGRDDMIGGLSDDWASQPQHAALLLSGLKRLETLGMENVQESLVVVGLPARLFASQRKAYHLMVSEHLPKAEVKVVPQSMGPYYAMMFAEDGQVLDGFEDSSWAFVEVGQFTTDFAMIDRDHVVDRSFDSFDSFDGMCLAAEQLQRIVLEQLKTKIGLSEATDLLAKPGLRSFGREIDASSHIAEAVPPLAHTIADKAAQVFRDSVRTLCVLRVAGGGAPLVRDILAKKWVGEIPANFVPIVLNSRFAVAEGLQRFATGLLHSRMVTA